MSTDLKSSELPEVDITPLEQALGQLEKALLARLSNSSDEFIRDAVIQRFEFTYELSLKTLVRYLKTTAATDDEVTQLTFRELIRLAIDRKLLEGDVLTWVDFRQARNDTVHTYNEMRAVEVADVARQFAVQARTLVQRLRERITS